MKKRISAVAVAVAAVSGSFAILSAPASASDQFTVTLNATVTGSCKFSTGQSNSTITIGNGGAGSNIDPSSATSATGTGTVKYNCTKGQTPTLQYAVGAGALGAPQPSSITLSCAAANCGGTADSMTAGLTWTNPASFVGLGFGAGNEVSIGLTATITQANFQNAQVGGPYTNTVKFDIQP